MHSSTAHLLPLNSMIFRSRSSTDLREPTAQHDFYANKRYSRTDTALPRVPDSPDNGITALPPSNPPLHKPLRSKKSLWAKPRGTHEASTARHQSHAEKKSALAHISGKIKRRLKFLLWMRASKDPDARPEMVIGPPTDVKHVQSGAGLALGGLPLEFHFADYVVRETADEGCRAGRGSRGAPRLDGKTREANHNASDGSHSEGEWEDIDD